MTPGPNVINLFTNVYNKLECLFLASLFSQCLWVRPELTRVKYLSGAPLLPTNIILGCKGFTGTNTLAYNQHSYCMAMKSFITLGPGVNVLNFFFVAVKWTK